MPQNKVNSASMTVEQAPKKKKNVFLEILKWIFYVVFGTVIIFNVWTGIDRASGYHFSFFGIRQFVITSGSMSAVNDKYKDELKDCTDQIQVNDLVFTNANYTYESLKIHDIIVFRYGDKGVVCHRIYDMYVNETTGQKCIITKGDANATCDSVIDYNAAFLGKVVGKIPGVGGFITFLTSPYGLLGLFGVVACVSVGLLIYDSEKEKKEKVLENSGDSSPSTNSQESMSEPKEEPTKEEPKPQVKEEIRQAKPVIVKVKCAKCGHVFTAEKSDKYVCPKCKKVLLSKH